MGHKLWCFVMFSETCVNQFVFVCFLPRWVKLGYNAKWNAHDIEQIISALHCQ